MKKILSSMAGMMLIGSAPLSVVACGSPNKQNQITYDFQSGCESHANIVFFNKKMNDDFFIWVKFTSLRDNTEHLLIFDQKTNPVTVSTLQNHYGLIIDKKSWRSDSSHLIKHISYNFVKDTHWDSLAKSIWKNNSQVEVVTDLINFD